LWAMIDVNLSISDCPVSRDVTSFFGGKEEDCVGPIGDAWFALCKSMDLFAHCPYPEMFEVRIMLQLLVLCYGLLGDRMDNSETVLLNVDDGPSPLQIGGYFHGLKSHDVMHRLDGDVSRQMRVDDTVEQQGGVDDHGMGQPQRSLSGSMMLYEGEAAIGVGVCIHFLLGSGHRSCGICENHCEDHCLRIGEGHHQCPKDAENQVF
jgi:hypothetical protein